MNNKGFTNIAIGIIIAVGAIIAVGVVGYTISTKTAVQPNFSDSSAQPSISGPFGKPYVKGPTGPPPGVGQPAIKEFPKVESEDVLNWNIYDNKKYGFSFKYPKNWELSSEYDSIPASRATKHSFGASLYSSPSVLRMTMRVSCYSGDASELEQLNNSGDGNDIALYTSRNKIHVKGTNVYKSPGEEGEPFGFMISECNDDIRAKPNGMKPCVVFHGYNGKIDENISRIIGSTSIADWNKLPFDCVSKS